MQSPEIKGTELEQLGALPDKKTSPPSIEKTSTAAAIFFGFMRGIRQKIWGHMRSLAASLPPKARLDTKKPDPIAIANAARKLTKSALSSRKDLSTDVVTRISERLAGEMQIFVSDSPEALAELGPDSNSPAKYIRKFTELPSQITVSPRPEPCLTSVRHFRSQIARRTPAAPNYL